MHIKFADSIHQIKNHGNRLIQQYSFPILKRYTKTYPVFDAYALLNGGHSFNYQFISFWLHAFCVCIRNWGYEGQ